MQNSNNHRKGTSRGYDDRKKTETSTRQGMERGSEWKNKRRNARY